MRALISCKQTVLEDQKSGVSCTTPAILVATNGFADSVRGILARAMPNCALLLLLIRSLPSIGGGREPNQGKPLCRGTFLADS